MEMSRSMQPRPTLCVINYNGASVLPDALSVACTLRDRFAEMLVIDNGSTDGSVDTVERDFPPFRVIRLGANLGAGGARNAGLSKAASDLILFIDNDVALTAVCVDELVASLSRHPRAALAAAAVVYAHQRDTIQYDGAECHFLGIQTLLDENRPLVEVERAVRKVGSIVTCCFLADRSRLPADVTFDEDYFYQLEDHDFGVRVRSRGSEILSVPTAICYHGKGTAGLSIRETGTYTSKRVYYLIRNRWLFVLKNFSLRTLLLLAPLFAFYECAQFAIVLKKRWLAEWWSAATWIVANLPQILSSRRQIQRSRRVADRDILKGGRIPFRRELTVSPLEDAAQRLLNAVASTYWAVVRPLI
jgi:hypothetical protein